MSKNAESCTSARYHLKLSSNWLRPQRGRDDFLYGAELRHIFHCFMKARIIWQMARDDDGMTMAAREISYHIEIASYGIEWAGEGEPYQWRREKIRINPSRAATKHLIGRLLIWLYGIDGKPPLSQTPKRTLIRIYSRL